MRLQGRSAPRHLAVLDLGISLISEDSSVLYVLEKCVPWRCSCHLSIVALSMTLLGM